MICIVDALPSRGTPTEQRSSIHLLHGGILWNFEGAIKAGNSQYVFYTADICFTCSAVLYFSICDWIPPPPFIFNWQFFICSTCFYFSHVFFFFMSMMLISTHWGWFYCSLSLSTRVIYHVWKPCDHTWHEATVGHQVGAICLVLSWCACHGPYILKRQEQESVKGVYPSQYS